jgi:hypothetical protein
MSRISTLAWASFPTRDEADHARRRLEKNGFARNSISLDRRQDGSFCVKVHTSEENLSRVENILQSTGPMYAMRQLRSNVVDTVTTNPMAIIGAAVLAGLVGYSLLPRNRRTIVHSIREMPRRVREAAQDFPETISEAARSVRETAARN